jgi:sugar phosphate isomerase/epimerase
MKLSILPVSLFRQIIDGRMTIAEWARAAQNLGVDGFDISSMFFKNHTAAYIEQIQNELIEHRITIQPTMVCCYPDFTNPDPTERERQIDYLNRDIALFSKFGFQFIRITAGQNHPCLKLDEAAAHAAECFKRAADTADRYGIRLVFENHSKPSAWPMIDFSFQPEAFLAVYDRIRDVNIGINFDTANAACCGADPARLLEQVIDKVWTVHLNETKTVGTWTPALLGTGIVDFDSIFDVLNKHNFDSWICIEEASGLGMLGIKDAISFARKYVAPQK